jgi:hypothetical protein
MLVGNFLMKGILDFASENGYCRVNLKVRRYNYTAKSLYKKDGIRIMRTKNALLGEEFLKLSLNLAIYKDRVEPCLGNKWITSEILPFKNRHFIHYPLLLIMFLNMKLTMDDAVNHLFYNSQNIQH